MKNVHWSVLVMAGLCSLLLAQGDAYASGKKGGHEHIVKKGEFCITNPHTGQRADATVFLKGAEGRKLKHAFRHLSKSKFISTGPCVASPSGRGDHIKIALKWKDWDRWGHSPKGWRGDRDDRSKGTNARHDGRGGDRLAQRDRRLDHDSDSRFFHNGFNFVKVGKPRDSQSDGQFRGLLGYVFPVIASLDPWKSSKRWPHTAPRIWYNPERDIVKVSTKRYWLFAIDKNNRNI